MISVIIPTHEPNIGTITKTLKSIQRDIKHWKLIEDVIIVDNGPSHTPHLQNLVDQFGYKYVYTDKTGANHARNLGVSHASGNILFFTDDDCILDWDCLHDHHELHTNQNCVVGGKVNLKYEADPPQWMCSAFEHMLAKLDWTPTGIVGDTVLDITDDPGKYIVSANMSIGKAAFNLLGGFDERHGYSGKRILSPNDEMMLLHKCRESNCIKVLFTSSAEINHLIPKSRLTEEYFYKRYYGQGVADCNLAVCSEFLDKLDHPIDPKDYELIVTNTVLKQALCSSWFGDILEESLEKKGDIGKNETRELVKIYTNCVSYYIRGVRDFIDGEL
jgi:hypothetical protein